MQTRILSDDGAGRSPCITCHGDACGRLFPSVARAHHLPTSATARTSVAATGGRDCHRLDCALRIVIVFRVDAPAPNVARRFDCNTYQGH